MNPEVSISCRLQRSRSIHGPRGQTWLHTFWQINGNFHHGPQQFPHLISHHLLLPILDPCPSPLSLHRLLFTLRIEVLLTDATGGAKFTENTQGGADSAEATVNILNCDETRGFVDKIASRLQYMGARVGTKSYAEQFEAAFFTNGSKEEAEGVNWISADFVLHAFGFPWKMVFAFIPPTDFFGGWLCFMVALGAHHLQNNLGGGFSGQPHMSGRSAGSM